MHVNEQMSYEFSEYMDPHLNIHNISTRSHASVLLMKIAPKIAVKIASVSEPLYTKFI